MKRPKKIEKNTKKEKENLIKMFKTQENKNKAKLKIEKNKVKDLIKKIEEEQKPRKRKK